MPTSKLQTQQALTLPASVYAGGMLAEAGGGGFEAGKEAGMNEIGWQVRLAAGIVLGGMAGFAVRVDILNNWSYGMTVSEELASVMVLAAAGVVALPVVASITGWNLFLRLTATLFVALTVWAAANAYSAKQGASILAAEGAQQRYADAQKDAAVAREEASTARKEAASIAETVSSDDLAAMVTQAQSQVNDLTKRAAEMGLICASYRKCSDADAGLKALRDRHGKAKTKEEALARADKADAKVKEAKGEAKAGPAEASMLATVIARSLRADATDIARGIAIALTALSIIATQCAALLGGKAASLMSGAVKMRSAQRVAQKQEKPKPKPKGPARRKATPKRRLGDNVIKLDAVRKSAERWKESLNKGGETRGGDALKNFKRFAGRRPQG